MFEFELENADLFIRFLKSFHPALEEVIIKADKDGIIFSNLDPAHIRYFHLKVEKEFFDSYYFNPDKAVIGRLDIDRINYILEKKNNTTLAMTFDEEKNILSLKTGSRFQHEYNLKEVFSTKEAIEIPTPPNLDHETSFTINYNQFKEAIMRAGTEKYSLSLKNRELLIKGQNDDDTWEYLSRILLGTAYKKLDPIFSMFNRWHTTEFIAALKLDDAGVTIDLGNNLPLQLRFDLNHSPIQFTYLQAPRIESEE